MPATATIADALSTSAAARRAGVSPEAVRVWVRTGRLPATTTPLGILIDRAELDRFLAERSARRPRHAPAARGDAGTGAQSGAWKSRAAGGAVTWTPRADTTEEE